MRDHLNWWDSLSLELKNILINRYFPSANINVIGDNEINHMYLKEQNIY